MRHLRIYGGVRAVANVSSEPKDTIKISPEVRYKHLHCGSSTADYFFVVESVRARDASISKGAV